MKPELIYILNEMCNRVNADYDSINFQEQNWFYKHTWGKHEELDFVKWLADHLYNHGQTRKMFTLCRKNKKDTLRAASNFVFNFGWKIDYDEPNEREET